MHRAPSHPFFGPSYATDSATSFAKASDVKESFVGQRKIWRAKLALAAVFVGRRSTSTTEG